MASSSITSLAGTLGALVLAAAGPAAWAHAGPDDKIAAPPPTFQASGVTVDEHVGGRIPLDAKFRTQDGALVTENTGARVLQACFGAA